MELREIQKKDLNLIWQWRNQESIRKCMYNTQLISWEQHLQWYEQLKKNENKESKIFYCNHIPYGVVNIKKIHLMDSICEWGFYIGDLEAPKGMGTRLGYTALSYLFEEKNCRKICAKVLMSNFKSIQYHLSLGFSQEGVLREQLWRENGECEDIIVFGYLKREWEENKARLLKKIGDM